MIDLHSHLDLYPDALRLAQEVNDRNKFTLAVTTSPRAWVATSRVFAKFQNVHVGLGLHPEIAVQKANEESLLIESIKDAQFVGEIGLDGSARFKSSLPLQEAIFEAALAECSRVGGRVISLHSRGAAMKVLDLLEKYQRAGTPVLHWFSGTLQEVSRAVKHGCWFSVGPVMLSSAKGRELLSQMPRTRVLPESDGPFTTRNGRPLYPWEAMDVASVLGDTWKISRDEVIAQLNMNLNELLGLRYCV